MKKKSKRDGQSVPSSKAATGQPAADDASPQSAATDASAEAGEELSLEQLAAAFAEMMEPGEPADLSESASAEPSETSTSETATDTAQCVAAPVDRGDVTPASILEALLFVGDPQSAPIPAERLSGVMRGVAPSEVHSLVAELNAGYRRAGCPYTIESGGGGYRMTLAPAFDRLREGFFGRVRQARLSQAAIDALAIVAYNQPLTGAEVTRLRQSSSGAVLAQLVRRGLLLLERPPAPQEPIYRTTDRFLEVFGLESLADLPHSEDVDAR